MAAAEPQPWPLHAELGPLLTELQSAGARVDDTGVEGRRGGAGPSDAAMIWVEGIAVTFPFASDYVSTSPFVLRPEGEGWGLYRLDRPVGGAPTSPPPPVYCPTPPADSPSVS